MTLTFRTPSKEQSAVDIPIDMNRVEMTHDFRKESVGLAKSDATRLSGRCPTPAQNIDVNAVTVFFVVVPIN